MGFFSKKPRENKVYNLEQAMKFVRDNDKYSVVETSGGYKVITDDKAKQVIDEFQQRKNAFKDIYKVSQNNQMVLNQKLEMQERYNAAEKYASQNTGIDR